MMNDELMTDAKGDGSQLRLCCAVVAVICLVLVHIAVICCCSCAYCYAAQHQAY